MGGGSPIAASSNWGTTSGAIGANIDSPARTLTVPGGNSGQVQIFLTDIGSGGLSNYKKNAGAFTFFSDGDIITFADADTLTLRSAASDSAGNMAFEMRDADSGAVIGTYTATAS